MRYCTRCITPDTRPNVVLEAAGVCNACRAHAERIEVDWPGRERDFQSAVDRAKSRGLGYDCVIPVSGGKDSTWQVVKCLEYGLTPLAVTWKTPARTAIGQRNLDNLIRLGVDHIDYQINPRVERTFLYRSFVRFGSTAIPMHMALFSIPLAVAVRFRIPLVVWGENSACEYGGTDEARTGVRLDAAWRRTYGVTHGTTASDWLSDDLTAKELTAYFGPTDRELEEAGVHAVFLGHYFPWDPEASLATALAHGFEVRREGPRTGYYNFADIDDDFISIHHWLKWYKFGFTRLFDNLSLEIRHGRLPRGEALQILRRYGTQTPHADIARLCAFLGITQRDFHDIAESFRNQDVWSRRQGHWVIEDFILDDWDWDETATDRAAA